MAPVVWQFRVEKLSSRENGELMWFDHRALIISYTIDLHRLADFTRDSSRKIKAIINLVHYKTRSNWFNFMAQAEEMSKVNYGLSFK